jgi:hypothetical protein
VTSLLRRGRNGLDDLTASAVTAAHAVGETLAGEVVVRTSHEIRDAHDPDQRRAAHGVRGVAGTRGRAMTRIGTGEQGLAASLRAGALYFAVVFALGFAFAVVRDGLLHLGDAEATRLRAALVEIPVLLVAAWVACRIIVQRVGVPPTNAARVLMGVTAFALIVLAEAATGVLLLGRTLEAHLATYLIPSHAAGLAGQMVFAAFPWVQGVRSGRRPHAGRVMPRKPAGAQHPPRLPLQDRRGGTR